LCVARGSYLTPGAYAIMHRMHHAYSDTEKDPHSPIFFKDVFGMMWHTRNIFHGLVIKTLCVSPKVLGNYPEWKVLDKFAYGWASRLFWIAGYIIFYAFFATHWWMYLLLPIHFLMGPIQGAIVNWCGHKYGYQNYGNHDDSRNTLPFDFLTLGELFQNNPSQTPQQPEFRCKMVGIRPGVPGVTPVSLGRHHTSAPGLKYTIFFTQLPIPKHDFN
ncbi:MAG: fatty acid desaturase, partial [Desulfobacterales bacterium]